MNNNNYGGYRYGKQFTEQEDKYIIDNYSTMKIGEIADHLGCKYHQVKHRARKLGITKFKSRKWTVDEIEFLKQHYPTKRGQYCAEKLGRSYDATVKKAIELGIRPKWEYRYKDKQGYIILTHDRDNKIYEHRYIMEQHLGRPLKSTEIVHHINGIKDDNRIENLVITNRSEHINIHRKDLRK